MIIFDLDGTLADCEHRRHFIDPEKAGCYECGEKNSGMWAYDIGRFWKPDWKSFYECCDRDTPIIPVIDIYKRYWQSPIPLYIWSGRCESVRQKTLDWLDTHVEISHFKSKEWFDEHLKMRPIGTSRQMMS